MALEEVLLVTEADEPIGTMEKLQAHRVGALHRAFSVFIFNAEGRMLIQRRAAGKYHSPGLWTNACCSHPGSGETVEASAVRRLGEELGFTTALRALRPMLYRADVGGGLIEHEYDHLFVGRYSLPVQPAPEEASEVRYVGLPELHRWMESRPEDFTVWFHLALPGVLAGMQEREKV